MMIKELKENQVFVFGSNTRGYHGKGAALQAKQDFGAIQGQAEGLQGHSYGIPTRHLERRGNKLVFKNLYLGNIKNYVNRFIEFAKAHPELEFLVTEIGCGLAGYTVEQIAPLFCSCRYW